MSFIYLSCVDSTYDFPLIITKADVKIIYHNAKCRQKVCVQITTPTLRSRHSPRCDVSARNVIRTRGILNRSIRSEKEAFCKTPTSKFGGADRAASLWLLKAYKKNTTLTVGV